MNFFLKKKKKTQSANLVPILLVQNKFRSHKALGLNKHFLNFEVFYDYGFTSMEVNSSKTLVL